MILKPPRGSVINKAHPLAKGLVGCWLFNEGTGTIARDSSGYGNHGTLSNMAAPGTLTSGWGADGLAFDGSNDYTSCGNVFNDVIAGAGKKFTIRSIVKQSAYNAGTKLICGKNGDTLTGGNQRQFFLALYANTVLFAYFGDLAGETYRQMQTDVLVPNFYYDIVTTYDADLAYDSRVAFFINGSSIAIKTIYSVGNPAAIQSGTASFSIGAGYNTSVAYVLNGAIQSNSLYNRLLSPGEIAYLYKDPYCMFQRPKSPLASFMSYIRNIIHHMRQQRMS